MLRWLPRDTHGPTGGVRPEGIGVLQLALVALICQFFLSEHNGDTVSWLGYFRITFGCLLTGMEGALVLVVLYGVGMKEIRHFGVGAGWRIDP
jgi:hypothetical protein